jgi:uncharacterized protein YjbI with pentapeptide repeats
VERKKPRRKVEPASKRRIAWPRWTGFRGMTVRDWLQLLIVPLALVVIGFWFTMQQDARQQQLAEQRAQDEALQAYLDQMSNLLLEEDLRASEEDSEVRTLARARTLTVLERLDPSRKRAVVQFLVETELVQGVEETAPIINLGGADLSGGVYLRGADLSFATLRGANLSEANLSEANLRGANLYDAGLRGADLGGANLSEANLVVAELRDVNLLPYADLRGADLSDAELSDADLSTAHLSNADLSSADLSRVKLSSTDLSYADLSNADLSDANLYYADLSDANLSDANLISAGWVTKEQLEEQAQALVGATMPDGSKHP